MFATLVGCILAVPAQSRGARVAPHFPLRAAADCPDRLDGWSRPLHNAATPGLGGAAVPKLSDYLTVAQAAKLLGVSKDTLRRWDKAGKLTARRHPVTRYRLYLREELEAFLRQLHRDEGSTRRADQTGGKPARGRRGAR